MAKANSSQIFKPQKHFEIADNDMISKLPDSILCHILSFMPTKYSVQSSILSRRWRFTWTSVSVLDLSDQLFEAYHLPKKRRISASTKSYKNFVNTATSPSSKI
ncbi:F-box/RNI-like superfamily protein [Euphorbia peplus]|nr:F-box/RNI-like superfamily protein [Euphorbia peplus]